MRRTKALFPALILVVLLLPLMFFVPDVSYAGVPPTGSLSPDSGTLEIAGYSVRKNNSNFTGKIHKDDVITIVMNIIDTRIVTGVDFDVKPRAVLNTTSFAIPRQSNITYGTPAVDSNGCSYAITFKDLKYTGKAEPLVCDISYTGAPLPMETMSIMLSQCVKYNPPEKSDSSPEPDPPDVVVKGTGFVLKDARYGDGVIYAGKPFSLSAVILATNGTAAVENVSVAFSPPEEMTLSEGASIVYIGTMAPNASVPVSVTLLPGANIQEGSYTVEIAVDGVNQQTGDSVSAHMTISVPVLQPERFEIFNTMFPTGLLAGDDNGMGYGSVTLVNMGKGAVSNVSVEIFGDGLSTEEGRQYLGNIGAGEQKSADFYINADISGRIDALLVVSYENARGENKTLDEAFTIEVMDTEELDFEDPGFEYPGEMEGGGVRAGLPPWLLILIIACAAAVVTAILVRRRRKRMAAREAALDDIDDDD